MESATHPRVIAGRLAPTWDHAGVCEFHQVAEKRTQERQDLESCPTRTVLHDSVDSCVTNHRIVREHAGGLLRRSWHTLLARGRRRPRTAPPRAQRLKNLRSTAPINQADINDKPTVNLGSWALPRSGP